MTWKIDPGINMEVYKNREFNALNVNGLIDHFECPGKISTLKYIVLVKASNKLFFAVLSGFSI